MELVGFIVIAISLTMVSSQKPTTSAVPDVTIVEVVTVKADAKVEVEEFEFVPPTEPQEEPQKDEGEGEIENDNLDPFSGDDDLGEGGDFGDETDTTTSSSQPGIDDKSSTIGTNDINTDIGAAVIDEFVVTEPKVDNIDRSTDNPSIIRNIENVTQPIDVGGRIEDESFATAPTNDVIAELTTDPLSFGGDLNDDTTTPQIFTPGSDVNENLPTNTANVLGGIVGVTQSPSNFNNLQTTVSASAEEPNPTTNLIVVGDSGAELIGEKTELLGVEPVILTEAPESRSAVFGVASSVGGAGAGGVGFANNNNNNNGDNNVNNNGNNGNNGWNNGWNNGFMNNNNNNNGNGNVNNNGNSNAGGNNNNNNNGNGNLNNNGGGNMNNNNNHNNNNNNNGNFAGSSANNNNNNNNNNNR